VPSVRCEGEENKIKVMTNSKYTVRYGGKISHATTYDSCDGHPEHSQAMFYNSGIQPGVRVPPGVREDILGGT
jgi:hypothetical protein